MQDYGFRIVAVRATRDDVRRWRDEAKRSGQVLGDYLKGKIDGISVAECDRSIEQTSARNGQTRTTSCAS